MAAEIKIGVVGPYTHLASADLGTSIKEGAMLAAAEINASGGVLGQKISLVSYDDKSKADAGVEIGKAAVDKKITAMIGSTNIDVVSKMAPSLQTGKIPYVLTAMSSGSIPDLYSRESTNYIFRLSSTDNDQANMLGKYVVDVDKHTKIAIFAEDSSYGTSGIDSLTKSLMDRKLTPAVVEKFKVGSIDMEDALLKARDAGAEALIIWGLGFEAAALKIDINRLGWRVPVYGSWTLSSKLYSDNAGPVASYSEMPVPITHDSKNPVYQQFKFNYQDMHRKSHIPNLIAAAQTYDSVYLLAMAIKQAGSTDGSKIVEALENLNGSYAGVLTNYQKPWSKSSHEFSKINSLLKIGILQDNGTIVEDLTE